MVGRGSRVVTEEVSCVSVPGQIGCRLSDGFDVSIPLDVAWTRRLRRLASGWKTGVLAAYRWQPGGHRSGRLDRGRRRRARLARGDQGRLLDVRAHRSATAGGVRPSA